MESIKRLDSEPSDVCLVLMPYVCLARPSLALGLLQASLKEATISCSTVYANLLFADRIGYDAYRLVECCSWPRIGDWTFAEAAFPNYRPDDEEYLEYAARFALRIFPRAANAPEAIASVIDVFRNVRAKTPHFIHALADAIVANQPKIVACSSNFQQHVASLALLQQVRERDPDIVTIIGGANCEDRMGVATVYHFPWVDIAFSGEADEVFADLCRMLINGGGKLPTDLLPEGAIDKKIALKCMQNPNVAVPRATVKNLNQSPIPDYSDYFDTLQTTHCSKRFQPGLIAETSRGCMWGNKKGCAFCGQNRKGMVFRSKTADRVLNELNTLSRKYRLRNFRMTDNVINPHFFNDLFPRLKKLQKKYFLLYVLRSTISRDEVRALREAGVVWVFFGIESLHDSWLELMNKGTSALTGLQALKYATEVGLLVTWHLLHDIPDEDENWYYDMASWLPLIHHLPPPTNVLHIAYDRFSTYQQYPEHYGIVLKPSPGYRYSYPIPPEALMDLAYSFETEGTYLDDTPGMKTLRRAVWEWKRAQARFVPPVLCMTDQGEKIDIFDTRPCAPVRHVALRGIEAQVYRSCDPPVRKDDLLEKVLMAPLKDCSEKEIVEAVAILQERKLLLEMSGKLFNLAVPGDIPIPVRLFPGGHDPLPSLRELMEQWKEE